MALGCEMVYLVISVFLEQTQEEVRVQNVPGM